jgi:hypothetical protein
LGKVNGQKTDVYKEKLQRVDWQTSIDMTKIINRNIGNSYFPLKNCCVSNTFRNHCIYWGNANNLEFPLGSVTSLRDFHMLFLL